ncbi:uncharacterized protein LOC4578369 isoform X1 [Anopheles gambiae]|uniref:uncharacterized protein LOC4578369 isoform X1 n=1 Tax=Anopheles gambiae TaxID=7165 RepID=UPI002AC983A9|nr:uncharacterized protein LOC4578369 isoform X1 [Anopheles gambiae]
MDPLRPARVEELKHLIGIYKQFLAQSIQFVSLLQNILRTNLTLHDTDKEQVSHRLQKTVYIPNNEKGNRLATFVAISREEDLFIFMNTLEVPPTELTHALEHTTYIKWGIKPMFVIGDNSEIRAKLSQLTVELKVQFESWSDCVNYWMPQTEAAKLSYIVPADVDLKPLQVQHAKQLNEWWPYRYRTSQQYFESAIKYFGAFGLFDKTSGELVACVFQNDHDAVGHLYTVHERCNRGYGCTLAKAITKHIAVQYKQDVHTFIDGNNERSIRLFNKIGYKAVSRTEWLVASKH